MVRAAQEQSFARARMKPKAEIPAQRELAPVQMKKLAKAQELPAERWLREQALMHLLRREPGPRE